jgi:transglutaminase-like putative cysteine protease
MLLRATHTTQYLYSDPVSICHTEVHLAPRETLHQQVLSHQLTIEPNPDFRHHREDYFGNGVTMFSLHEPHETLTITASSVVDLPGLEPPDPALTLPWDIARDEVRKQENEANFEAYAYMFESPRVPIGREFAGYATPSFSPGRPVLEAAADLSARIFKEFHYDQRATTVTTPVAEVLRKRRGVCQDFAHFMISCLRSIGLPARYVSGYLRSSPETKGAEASHAWVSIFCPDFGWIDLDPTNNALPNQSHVTVSWGRDYADVTPVRGVALGGGEQMISVAVEVVPVQEDEDPALDD